MKNQVQLITYVDRLSGGSISDLRSLLDGPLEGLFGGVHLLPFYYPIDGADAGFDPIDHTRVDPRLGTWSDVKAFAANREVMADVIVNHISTDSEQFLSYSRFGKDSEFFELFLTRDKVFPAGLGDAALRAIYRPRPGLPFMLTTLQDGRQETLWTTFSEKQVDIDVRSAAGRAYLDRILRTLGENEVSVLRLDAAGYAIKKPGTSCFMIPETLDFIAELAGRAAELGMETLVEVHSHFRRQIEIASNVDWVYDFALPPLILHAFEFATSRYLREWLKIRPQNAVTVLDTHDGIGIIDIGPDLGDSAELPGLVPPEELDSVIESIHRNSHDVSRMATGSMASNLDLYQVNCTFYDAMSRDDRRYLSARAIQFFIPGVPQVYYVGLLAGVNDTDLLNRTGIGRDINRHYYDRAEVERDLKKPVVKALCQLMRLRNRHPAFDGEFVLLGGSDQELALRWQNGEQFAELWIDFRAPTGSRCSRLTYSAEDTVISMPLEGLLDGEVHAAVS